VTIWKPSKYEVQVERKQSSTERNGSPLQAEAGGNSNTVEGLFRTLDQEIELKENLNYWEPLQDTRHILWLVSTPRRPGLLRFSARSADKNSIEIVVRELKPENKVYCSP